MLKTNILVVDDTRANLHFLTRLLNKQGYQAWPAENAKKALFSAQRQMPDLILLDIMMPDMDGYQVCQQLKADERTRDIPVIFISALHEVLDKVKAFSVGGVDYITKPFRTEEVLARVQTHLGMRQLQQRLEQQNQALHKEISERKQVEVELVKAKKAAEMANQAKNNFLANLTHEFRTPLNTILGFSNLMSRNQQIPAEEQTNLSLIRQNAEQLLTLINHLLDLSQFDAGHIALNQQHFDLYRLLEDLEYMLHLRMIDKRLQLVMQSMPNVPQYVRTDEIKLRQVLMNLLNDIIKFSNEGRVSVRVSYPIMPSPKKHILFEIETGFDIAPNELESLWPISRQFIQLMGGEMSISSTQRASSDGLPEYRTVFSFDIAVDVLESNDIKRNKTREVVALEPNQPRYRVLIADHNKSNRQQFIKRLGPLGFELREASDGQEAIMAWQRWQPHLIWMAIDIPMPFMSGNEATTRIKAAGIAVKAESKNKSQDQDQDQESTVIIGLTTNRFEQEQATLLSVGYDDFLHEPFHEADIFKMMNKHLAVRYVYQESLPISHATSVPQNQHISAALVTLPADLLTELEKAVTQIDIVLIENLIADIRQHDATLANSLTTLADEFEYGQILALIEEGKALVKQ